MHHIILNIFKFAEVCGKIWPIATTKKNAKKISLFSICQIPNYKLKNI
jgi:hypothetical protein